MRHFLLPLVTLALMHTALAADGNQRTTGRSFADNELRATNFCSTDSPVRPFGQDPDLNSNKIVETPTLKVLPGIGSFIDEPRLPYLMGFSYLYPYNIYGIDYPDMTLTPVISEAMGYPTSIYLREGNFEGTDFSDNPGGSTLMQGSFDVAGNKNWQYTQFISKAEINKRPLRTAYDEREDRVYGLSPKSSENKEHYCFVSFSPTDVNDIKIINDNLAENQYCSALAWDPRDGSIVGVTVTGDVVRFNKTTGEATVIFNNNLPQDHVYFAGLVYSPRHEGFIWAWLPTQDGVTLGQDFYLIDTDKKTCKLIKSIAKSEVGVEQMTGLMVNEQYINPLAARPAIISTEGSSLSGTSHSIGITLPTQLENGSSISGKLRLIVRVGGISNTEGTQTIVRENLSPGSSVEINLGLLSDGLHRISVYTVTESGVWSRRTNLAKFIGEDTPLAPENVRLTQTTLTWDAVDTGMKGQNLAGKEIKYEVWVDEKLVGTTTSTSYSMNFDPVELLSHMAAVAAVNGDKKSALSFSERITVGEYRTIPAHFVPDASDVLLSTVLDIDGDEHTWGYTDYYTAWIKSAPRTGFENQDWLFLPKLNFDDPNALYEISFEMRTVDENASIELLIADTPAADSAKRLMLTETNTNTDFRTFSTVINTSGLKHLCFHPITQKHDIMVRNVKVTKTGGDIHSPEAVGSLKATPEPEGALTATIEFVAPTKAIDGTTLNATTELSFILSGENVTQTEVKASPGKAVSAQVTAKEGMTYLIVTPILSGKPGMPTEVAYFNGEDVPGNVKNFSVKLGKDPNTVHIGYNSPGHEGYNGGWSSTEGLKYYLLVKRPNASNWTRYSPVDYCNITFTINKGIGQEYVQWGVMTENNKGYSNDWPRTSITCGPAYTLPMRETMAGGSAVYNPLTVESPTEEYIGNAGFADPRQIKPEYAVPAGTVIGLMPPDDEKPGKSMVVFPYFSTENCANPVVNIRVLLDPEYSAQADLYANIYGKSRIKVGSWNAETPGLGFTTLRFTLPDELKNQKWVQLFVEGTFEGGPDRRYVAIERYTVTESREYDFEILSASTPTNMSVNQEAIIRATVLNNSATPEEAPELKLTYTDRAGIKIETTLTPTVDTPIGIDEEREYTYSFIPGPDALGEMTFSLSLPLDDVLVGNSYSATGSVVVGNAVMPPSLKAERRNDEPTTVDLTWESPYVFDGTETMEMLPAFSIDSQLGSFLNIDLDESLTYSWQNWDFPHEEEPHAFIVFDDRHQAIPQASKNVLKAHSGHQFLLALSPLNYKTADDWLISPEIEPGSDISFWLSTVSTNYGADMVGIYWSTGSTDPNDFEYLTYYRKNTEGWEELTCTLPENAKRFAIKYYSTDTFGILIDDISYTPADGVAELEGFEVIRNGNAIERLHTPELGYTDHNVDVDLSYTYNVVPYLQTPNGEIIKGVSSPTARVDKLMGVDNTTAEPTITVSGRTIIISGAESVGSVTTLDGISIPAYSVNGSRAIYKVDSGVYIVTAGQTVSKVMVR